ncbi:diguanylate cyclase [Neptuniibacter sp. PT8_73]|uniref:GGDEF domain-containing protein n=1 Tax=Neptuniibacter sp. PT8_73 TaxID=3398206 RepID=UPI0039F56293
MHNARPDPFMLFADGPAVMFRWRNEFGWPVEQVSRNLTEVFGYDKEQFLNGELGFASIVAPDDLPGMTQELTNALKEKKGKFDRSPYRIVDASGETRWVRDTIRVIRDENNEAVELYAFLMDIDAVKQAESELEKSRAYVQLLLDTIPDPTLVIDVNTYKVVSANQAASATYLKKDQKIDGLTCYQLSHKTDKPCSGCDEPCPITSVLASKKAGSVVHKHFDAQGLPFYVEVLASPMFDEKGNVVKILESHRDITQHIENQEVLQQKAFTDSLTSINNRAGFEKFLKQEIEKAGTGALTLGLVMFDLDHFKLVNDTYGHQVGDQVLIEIAKIVQRHIRSYDFFARWGGEEFMVLLPRSDLDAVSHVAETLRKTVDQHHFETVKRVSISLGATSWYYNDDMDSFIERADKALYESKYAGRNRVTILAADDV